MGSGLRGAVVGWECFRRQCCGLRGGRLRCDLLLTPSTTSSCRQDGNRGVPEMEGVRSKAAGMTGYMETAIKPPADYSRRSLGDRISRPIYIWPAAQLALRWSHPYGSTPGLVHGSGASYRRKNPVLPANSTRWLGAFNMRD